MQYKNLIDKYVMEQSDYSYIEPITDDMIEFNDVKIDKDITAYHLRTTGFVWFDDFELSWNMSVISIAKNIHTGLFNIVAVKD